MGTVRAMDLYKSYKARPEGYYLKEQEINSIGYFLLYDLKRTDAAITIVNINISEFPQSANAFDSMGEAYMVAGDNTNAIENYKKSLQLDPANDNARKMIEKLTQNK